MSKTKVVFRKFPEGDVIALFPDYPYSPQGGIWSYQHIGQHGEASPSLIEEFQPASPEEYADLLEELQSIGYNLKVLK